jgi:Rod binding domain-containing protein
MDLDSVSALSGLGSSAMQDAEMIDASSALRTTANAVAGKSDEKKKQLAKDFESVFITKLFDQVKESIGSLALDEEEEGISDQVHGLFWMYLAQDVADKGGFGMWKDIYRHFQEMDGSTSAPEAIDKEL